MRAHDRKARRQAASDHKNQALEGFTLPKLLWVKEHEPEIDQRIHLFYFQKIMSDID